GSGFVDQPALLARLTGLRAYFLPSFGLRGVGFGNCVLTRLPAASVRRLRLPGWREPRAALELDAETAGTPIRVLATHLGLHSAERAAQVHSLTRRARSGDAPTLLLGDLNCR